MLKCILIAIRNCLVPVHSSAPMWVHTSHKLHSTVGLLPANGVNLGFPGSLHALHAQPGQSATSLWSLRPLHQQKGQLVEKGWVECAGKHQNRFYRNSEKNQCFRILTISLQEESQNMLIYVPHHTHKSPILQEKKHRGSYVTLSGYFQQKVSQVQGLCVSRYPWTLEVSDRRQE